VGAAMVWSIYTVGARSLTHRHGSLAVTAWTVWVGTVGLVLLGLPSLADTALTEVPATTWAAVGYAGILALSVAYAIWYRSVRRIGTARTSAYSNLVPVVALLVAWIWLDEVPSVTQLLGAAVILAGLSVTRAARSPAAATRTPGPSA